MISLKTQIMGHKWNSVYDVYSSLFFGNCSISMFQYTKKNSRENSQMYPMYPLTSSNNYRDFPFLKQSTDTISLYSKYLYLYLFLKDFKKKKLNYISFISNKATNNI